MYRISTQTFVVYGNYSAADESIFDLEKAFNRLQIDDTITGCKYGLERKGDLAATNKQLKNYLKCMTLSIYSTDGKRMSVKIFKNGSIQVTGCKNKQHVLHCVQCVYTMLMFERVDSIHLLSVMMNANMEGEFMINREKLGRYLIDARAMNIPPLADGYMGIKVSLPVFTSDLMIIPIMSWSRTDGFVDIGSVSYREYFSDNPKKRDKIFKACIGIFQNGKVLISSVDERAVNISRDWILELFSEAREHIEIKPKQVSTLRR